MNWSTNLNSKSLTGGDSSWNDLVHDNPYISTKLNQFVGAGDIDVNTITTTISVSKSGGSTAAFAAISSNASTMFPSYTTLSASESIEYTYLTHGNASFNQYSDSDAFSIDFGMIGNGNDATRSFDVFASGDLGLKNFVATFLSGDDVFSISGGDIAAGSSASFEALFSGQTPSQLTNYSGNYRLTFADNVSSLAQYASNSVGTTFIDLTMSASVEQYAANVPEPESTALIAIGLGLVGRFSRKKKMP
ncbi:PEP-CTERM sorting domain-containing protein [Thiorhodococcus mannitoliphagus]|uniref:PEP-CTERM sorting domain-containing protein n=1 Tax=Thiorhodococcus mannitoliphagus TaxID=329406 RepID=A0A6P1E2P3_9GAMM|nr:PEP-CTERM sorting domain-containing protein [Thiorhodococcus mannitoliphagus]NEX23621.1 PEP-CTERM sorting domain-containing protein [Thiorhodococcus mannitoliphagus]